VNHRKLFQLGTLILAAQHRLTSAKHRGSVAFLLFSEKGYLFAFATFLGTFPEKIAKSQVFPRAFAPWTFA
jgi:hypothetical protein